MASPHDGSVGNKGRDGRWRGRVMVKGQVYTVSSTVSKSDCRRLLRIKTVEVLEGRAPTPARPVRRAAAPAPTPVVMTVALYLETWLAAKGRSLRSSAGHATYAWAVRRHIVPAPIETLDPRCKTLGDLPLVDLRPSHVQGVIAAIAQDSTARLTHAVFRAALNDGLREERTDIAPGCARVRGPSATTHEIQWPKPDELDAICVAAASDELIGDLIITAAHTGMRQGECAGLRRRLDLHLVGASVPWLDVVRQISHHDGKLRELKSAAARRRIHLGPAAVEALQRRLERQDRQQAAAGAAWRNPDGLLFTDRLGRPLHHEEIRVGFIAACDRAGLEHVYRFHDLRHGHAMRLLGAGVALEAIRQRLGHASIATTSAHYFHTDPRMDAEAALLAEAFDGA